MINPELPHEEINNPAHFPMLIEYSDGGQDIVTRPSDIPNGVGFYILETNFEWNGRFITGSVLTKQ